MNEGGPDYGWTDAKTVPFSRDLLLPKVFRFLDTVEVQKRRLFDLGCGNGGPAADIAARGWEVHGVDIGPDGIKLAQAAYPGLDLRQGSAYDDLAKDFGRFPVVMSLEVVEHLFDPKRFARTLADLVEPGGTAIVSTPYHGYWKNCAVALSGKWDEYHLPLWDNGHIKFFSKKTLAELLGAVGLEVFRYETVGRIPPLAMSMIAYARRRT